METKLLSLGGFLTLGRGLNDVGEMLFCTLLGVREHFWPPLTGCQYEFSLSEPNIAEHHPAPPRVEVENRCSASGLTLCSSCLYVCICVCMCACLHVCAHLHTLVWNIYVCVFHKNAASPTHITKSVASRGQHFSVGIANQQESLFCQPLGTKDMGNTRPWAGQREAGGTNSHQQGCKQQRSYWPPWLSSLRSSPGLFPVQLVCTLLSCPLHGQQLSPGW